MRHGSTNFLSVVKFLINIFLIFLYKLFPPNFSIKLFFFVNIFIYSKSSTNKSSLNFSLFSNIYIIIAKVFSEGSIFKSFSISILIDSIKSKHLKHWILNSSG